MFGTFNTALSGLRAHQTMLDVVGNNLANVNTAGFWGSRVSFSDMLSRTIRSGTAPTTNQGGTNPNQLGSGVFSSNIEQIASQGAINTTGRTFDLALQGQGFFVLNDGNTDLYSRVGTFGFDGDSFLVDTRTGYRVQSNLGNSIQIDSNSTNPASATSAIQLAGNLPAEIKGPLPEILTTSSPFEEGTAPQLSGVVTLPPADGDFTISIDGSPTTVTLTNAATINDVVTQINAALQGAVASEDPLNPGTLLITSDSTGNTATLVATEGSSTTAADLGLAVGVTARGTVSGPATLATDLNDLPNNTANYSDTRPDTIQISGFDVNGFPVSAVFTYGAAADGTTLGDLVNKINGAFGGSTASVDADGNLVLTSDTEGSAALSLSLIDDDANTGSTRFASHALSVTQDGAGADEVVTEVEIFDTQGRSFPVTLTFTRQQDNLWDLTASIDDDDVTVSDATITGIRFGDDGKIIDVADSARAIEFTFPGIGGSQSITLDLDGQEGFEGLTQFGGQGTAFASSQDGYSAGVLAGISVGSSGDIVGLYSNGQIQTLDSIGLVNFTNPEGLTRDGNSLFQISANSGDAQTLAPGQGSSRIISGALEGSNVDLTVELVKLIVAQRGFQVNARSINSANLILQEAINIVQ